MADEPTDYGALEDPAAVAGVGSHRCRPDPRRACSVGDPAGYAVSAPGEPLVQPASSDRPGSRPCACRTDAERNSASPALSVRRGLAKMDPVGVVRFRDRGRDRTRRRHHGRRRALATAGRGRRTARSAGVGIWRVLVWIQPRIRIPRPTDEWPAAPFFSLLRDPPEYGHVSCGSAPWPWAPTHAARQPWRRRWHACGRSSDRSFLLVAAVPHRQPCALQHSARDRQRVPQRGGPRR